jgi:hypothetical protein
MKKKTNGKKMEVRGRWVEGSVQDFLRLFEADKEYIEMRLARSHSQKKPPQAGGLPQS